MWTSIRFLFGPYEDETPVKVNDNGNESDEKGVYRYVEGGSGRISETSLQWKS